MANLLEASLRIINNPIVEVKAYYQSKNRANSVGDALEKYIKDVFADTSTIIDDSIVNVKYSETFSYLGNQSNPPDIILKGGDAIETKKVEGLTNGLALNSSYPKSKLTIDNPMITKACKVCEDWESKDIIYSIGCTNSSAIRYLWFIYGDCFIADKEVYERIRNIISKGVNSIPNVEFTLSKELGKVKKVDPLGTTDLRIRGMWHIENPHKTFQYLNCTDNNAKFQFIVLMLKNKFESFSIDDQNNLLKLEKENYTIKDVKIKNPDNPANLIDAVLIIYRIYK